MYYSYSKVHEDCPACEGVGSVLVGVSNSATTGQLFAKVCQTCEGFGVKKKVEACQYTYGYGY